MPSTADRESELGQATVVTILFTDLVASTETMERIGDDRAEDLRRAHFRLVRDAAAAHGGRTVKSLGDGLMIRVRRRDRGGCGWHRHAQVQRAGAAPPRRALRRVPPREHRARARDRRPSSSIPI